MIKFTLALSALCFSTFALAGSTNQSKIEQVLITGDGSVFFRAGVQISPPACSAANEWGFQVAGSNASGRKALLAQLLAAQIANKNIRIVGTGVCDINSERETVGYIIVN